MLKTMVTLKSRLRVTQSHFKLQLSIDRVQVPISIPQDLFFCVVSEILNF